MLCGRTSSIITASLSLLLAVGMHLASGGQPAATDVAAASPVSTANARS